MSKKLQDFFLEVAAWAFVIGFFLLLMHFLCGCSTKYVAVPEYHTEYVSKTDTFIKRDSIMKHDSVYVSVKGDTVTVEKWSVLYRDRWREKSVYDTIIKVDSIRVPYPVERKLTKWQAFQIKAGAAVLYLAVAIGLFWLLLWLIRKHSNR